MSYEDDLLFENEVRRIARARWPQAQFDGASLLTGRERDGIFETDDVIHYVEATTSRRADKARDDTKKIFSAMSQQQRSGSMKGAVGWFVTKDEPTADQREEVKQHGKQQVKAVSFAQFQQALIDVPAYLAHRQNHFFGSVIDPATGALKPTVDYIPLDLVRLDDGELLPIEILAESLAEGRSYALLGDYGAGKSMTLRQLFYLLQDRYRKGGSPLFPLYINLREHSGQDDPSELLERHGRRIGLEKPHTLVSAWRAGFSILIIDGFDEITTLGISGARTKLKETRRRSLEAVRKLIEQTPHSTGFVIAGREHFFNSPEERKGALGLRSDTITAAIGEFNAKQIQKYLKNFDGMSNVNLPPWLPTRPLLVAYIAARGLLCSLNDLDKVVDPIDGWHYLLDRIFEREAKISPNLDGATLRRILERLSTIARSTPDGLGPLSQQQIRTAFIQICETEPDEQANLLLQRLPGLGVYRSEEDSRTFIDTELAEVCRAKDIFDFILNPYGSMQDEGWKSAISLAGMFIGQSAVTRICRNLHEQDGFTPTWIDNAFTALKTTSEIGVLTADLSAVCMDLPHSPVTEMLIEGAVFENYSLVFSDSTENFGKLTFSDCLFESIEIESQDYNDSLPTFQGCVFMLVKGRSGPQDLPTDRFDSNCSFEEFSDSAQTQSSILNSSLTKGEKLALTVLRKLFVQSLSGRAESALYRGLDLNDRQLIPDVIKLLQQHNLLMLYNRGDGNIWLPDRKQINRARKILASPNTCGEQVMVDARAIGR